jgi:multidrug efflux pump subunit AcrB
MGEIRGALIMSTIAIILAFAPLYFITGMMGPYMAPMAFNVPISVMASTLVAFLVTPWLAFKLLKPTPGQNDFQVTRTGLYRDIFGRCHAAFLWIHGSARPAAGTSQTAAL